MGLEDGSILQYGEDVLRRTADEYPEFSDDLKALIQRMYEIMAESSGLGLAGPQVGVSRRIFVYDVGEGPHALINPRIVKSGGEEVFVEGCLSMPGLHGEVTRAGWVTVTGINEHGKKVKIKSDGLFARVVQHEIDHLDGTLFVDKADPETLSTSPIDDDEFDME
jgi:peptide deformylase